MLLAGAASHQSPAAAIVDDVAEDDNDVQRVLDSVIDEFLQIVDTDRQTARQYITDNEMNVEQAICAYYDDQTS